MLGRSALCQRENFRTFDLRDRTSPMAENFKEAARRMFQDAETLKGSGRLGTPDHLYGLAAECALKAILAGMNEISIPTTPADRRKYPHVNVTWNEYLSAICGRSAPVIGANPFESWRAEHRYEADVLFNDVRLRAHRDGARAAMGALDDAVQSGVIS